MHNIHELEQRWKKYKIKTFIPYIITLVFSVILVIALIFINNTKKNIPTNQNIEKAKFVIEKSIAPKPNVQTQNYKEDIVKNSIIEKKVSLDEKLVLSPSLDFMKKLRTDSVNSYDNNFANKQKYKKNTAEVKKKKPVKQKPVKQKTYVKKQTKDKKPNINISSKETQNDIQHVIKRFKKNNNPALSLFVAKKYYKLGNYKKAYNYALITNQINNDIEDSWIIFAKSLVKMKKKNLAIKTLSKYVKHSHSGNARVLLDDIKAGKFK